jgi:hypothetical protein
MPSLLDSSDDIQVDGLVPLNIIRTETILSKLPVHNLAKKGKVDIRIVRRSPEGEVHLKWEVSHSDRYGQPRQLAYKLDTLVVNKRIDDAQRPLPVLIRIGSLKEVCRTLGIQQNGKNLRDIRLAFLQNASAFINAQFTYRTAQGGERRLEAGFTRYGVIFTGDKLPDGGEADAVYIALNAPYWEVVNTAPFRPLNYDYLRELTPAAQRFYEILSFRIFAALRSTRLTARITYSDYCAFSAQKRYYDHEHFRVQMYKIHKPHLQSGYLKRVEIQPASDGEGKTDWLLTYTPGPKARAEFETFSRKHQYAQPALITQLPVAAEPAEPDDMRASSSQNLSTAIESQESRALAERGISDVGVHKLLGALREGQPVLDQLEWGDFLIRRARPGTFRNPPGFYFSLVRDDIRPPATFETSRHRKLHEDAQQELQQRQAHLASLQLSYDEYQERETKIAFEAMPLEQRNERIALRRLEYARRFAVLPPETLDEISIQGVRREIAESLPLLSFAEFCRRQDAPDVV